MSWIDTVIRYWFGELGPRDWFSARPEVDRTIDERFAGLHAALKHEPPDMEALSAAGHVATVLVFDQFSRNLFRGSAETYATDGLALVFGGSAETYATDGLALVFATHAVDRSLDASLDAGQRQFLYMPFMHSEDRAMQARSVQLFRALADPDVLRYAVHHAGIVERFGRFPHRNEILGRTSTEAEREFLEDPRPIGRSR